MSEKQANRLWEAISTFKNPAEKPEERDVWGEEGMQNSLSDIHVPTMKKEEGAFRFKPKDGLRKKYYNLPFGEFLEALKKAKKDLEELDMTKFEDKGAKVSVDEFLQHPLWTFRVPINRLRELKKYEALYLLKILETKENAVKFIVFPKLTFKKAKEEEGNSLKWYLVRKDTLFPFANQYFDAFKQQLERFVRQNRPLVISLEKSGCPGAFSEPKNVKAFFDTKTFRGVGFEFEEKVSFVKELETYNKNKKDVKHTIEWFPESKTTCPAIYFRPEKWRQPSEPEKSKEWLNESVWGAKPLTLKEREELLKKGVYVPRLTVLKENLKREVNRILGDKSEPDDERKKEKRKKGVDALRKAIDDLKSDDWQVVLGIKSVKDDYEVATKDGKKDGEPILLLDENASILKGPEADFALRLCNGFPLLKEQQDKFRKFVKWATKKLCQWEGKEHKSSPCIKAVLRFFLSWPDMGFVKTCITWKGGNEPHLELSSTWTDSWKFTLGQLMNVYENKIDWYHTSFDSVSIKDTDRSRMREDYKDVTKKWRKNNDSLRNMDVANRKKLEERVEMFLKSLKGFTDWDTEGGTIGDWEDYQLKRWEAYKDLTKKDKDLPKESLTTRKDILKAKEKAEKK